MLAGVVRRHSTQAAPLVDSPLPSDERCLTAEREIEYLQKVLTSRVYDVCRETPLQLANSMSKVREAGAPFAMVLL